MNKSIAWTTADGKSLTLMEIEDLHLVNICKHIVLRLEINIDILEFYASQYAPTGEIALQQTKNDTAHCILENTALTQRLQSLSEEMKRRGLTLPVKEHVNKWN